MRTFLIPTLILAGGKSSRMGQDKALLTIHGSPLIRRIYDVAAQSCPPVYVISPWCDRYRSVLPNTCQLIDEQIGKASQKINEKVNEKTNHKTNKKNQFQGPLIGFYQGFNAILEQLEVDWLLLLACDLPNLNPMAIQSWSSTLSDLPPSITAALPAHCPIHPSPHPPKQWNPLCGFYHRRCLPSLKQYIETGGRSFQRWLVNEEVRSLPIASPNLLFNCNTPEDWKQWCKQPYL